MKINIKILYYLYFQFYSWIQSLSFLPQYYNYISNKSGAPDLLKRMYIKNLLQRYSFKIAIESGTYLGKTSKILKKHCENVYSIEINEDLFNFCKSKYKKKNINFILGDSGKILKNLVQHIMPNTFIFLDGHTSGGITGYGSSVTPLKLELEILGKATSLQYCLILIDDSQSLVGENDYPNFSEIVQFCEKHGMELYEHKYGIIKIMGSEVK